MRHRKKKSRKVYAVLCAGQIVHGGLRKKAHARRMAREMRAYRKGCTVRKVTTAYLARRGW